MKKLLALAVALPIAACSTSTAPPPNSAQAQIVGDSIQVNVSDTQPASSAALVGPAGETIPAAGIAVKQTPYQTYSPPPTIGLGIGGFSGHVGSGLGLGLPLGSATPAGGSDQYVSAVTLPIPAGYAKNWQSYKVQVQVGNRLVTIAAPSPG
jgi:hypothetical protein